MVMVIVLTADDWFTWTEPKLTEGTFEERAGPLTIEPVTEMLAVPPEPVTVKAAATEAAVAVAGGVSLRPTVQVSPLLRVALVAQVLLEIVIFASLTDAVRAPDGVVDEFVTVKITSAPAAPGATEPRVEVPVIAKLLGRVGVPFSVMVATEAPAPLSVMVKVAVSPATTAAAGEYVTVTAQVAPASRVTMLHVSLATLKSAAFAPLKTTVIAPVDEPPVFPTLIVAGELVAPGAATSAATVGVAPSLAAVTTVAVTGTLLETPSWVTTTASVADDPTAVAVKLITTLQVAPAARVAAQVEEGSSLRSAPVTAVVRPVRAALAVTVTIPWAVWPTVRMPSGTVDGLTLKLPGSVAVPTTLIVMVLAEAAETATLPEITPAFAGVAVIESTQAFPTPKVPAHPLARMPIPDGVTVTVAAAVPVLVIFTVDGVEVLPTSTEPTVTLAWSALI